MTSISTASALLFVALVSNSCGNSKCDYSPSWELRLESIEVGTVRTDARLAEAARWPTVAEMWSDGATHAGIDAGVDSDTGQANGDIMLELGSQ